MHGLRRHAWKQSSYHGQCCAEWSVQPGSIWQKYPFIIDCLGNILHPLQHIFWFILSGLGLKKHPFTDMGQTAHEFLESQDRIVEAGHQIVTSNNWNIILGQFCECPGRKSLRYSSGWWTPFETNPSTWQTCPYSLQASDANNMANSGCKNHKWASKSTCILMYSRQGKRKLEHLCFLLKCESMFAILLPM